MSEAQGENRNPSVYTLKMIQDMTNKIDEIKTAINELRIDIAGLPEKIFEKGDKRYAGKLVEKILYGLVGVVLTAILMAVIYSVLK